MTPSRRQVYNKIKAGLKSGLYKGIRLSKIVEGEKEILVPFNRINPGQGLERFEYIQNKLELNSMPGEYLIECRTGLVPSSIVDEFTISIKSKMLPPDSGEKETHEKEEYLHPEVETMNDIDFEEYKRLVEENAKLKGNEQILLFKIKMLEDDRAKPLADAPSTGGGIIAALSEHAPSIIGAFDEFLKTQNRKLDIEEKKLDNRKGYPVKKKNTARTTARQKSKEDILEEMINLEQTDPEGFDKTLDDMEVQNPELYNFICDAMGLEEEEEEGEQQPE
jgi:hypothetical protein